MIHFKNRAIGVLPVDAEGYTYLVGQWRYPHESYSWEIPEGGGALDRDPLDEAKRELREETGLSAGKWEKFFEMDLSNSVTDERAIVYLARDLTVGEAAPEETEVLSVRRVSLREAWDRLDAGEIRDSMTVAALLKARIWRLEGKL